MVKVHKERCFRLARFFCSWRNHPNLDMDGYKMSCTTARVEKCNRLIFVGTHGGKGISFLDGHGIHLTVSFAALKRVL